MKFMPDFMNQNPNMQNNNMLNQQMNNNQNRFIQNQERENPISNSYNPSYVNKNPISFNNEINNNMNSNNMNNNMPNIADLLAYINLYKNANANSKTPQPKGQNNSPETNTENQGSLDTSTEHNTPNSVNEVNITPIPQSKSNDQLHGKEKEKDKKKKKPFVERVGDWVCIKCKNLNFSFRLICNRCQLTKIESEKLFEQYMKNLMNYVKLNEILQNQLINNPNMQSSEKVNFLTNSNLNALSQLGNLRTLTNFAAQLNTISKGNEGKQEVSTESTGTVSNSNNDRNYYSGGINEHYGSN